MNRTFYSFAALLTGVAFFIYFIHSLFYFQLGRPLYTMQSFASWFVLTTIINLVASLVILKYLSNRKYGLSLTAGIISTIAQFGFAFLVYGMMMGMDLMKYYITIYMVSLGAGILYGVSLVPAPAGKRPWLKAAGILIFLVSAILLAAVASFTIQSLNIVEVDRIHQWTSLASMFIPGLFMMNFLSERRQVKEEPPHTSRRKTIETIMAVAAVITVLSTLTVAAKFSTQALGAIAWHRQAPERVKRLAEPFEARTFESGNGGTLLYRFMRPVDYDSTKTYPLVVCLHHGGTHGDDNMKQIDGSPIAQILSGEETRRKYPAFLFVPQCPEGTGWGGISSLPVIDSLVFEGLQDFEKEFSIDKKRRYVTGISGGGYGSWHFICSRPEMFAAAIPVCGGTDPALASRVVDVPVWAFHGAKDTNVPVRHSRDMIDAIKKAGGDPRYTEFPDQAHNIWPQVIQTPGLLEWMFAQRRVGDSVNQ